MMDVNFQRQLEDGFRRAVAELPDHLQAKASDLHSTRFEGGRWEICSSNGEVLNPVPKAEPKPVRSAPARNMSRETQAAILRACARFTNKKFVEVLNILSLAGDRIEAIEERLKSPDGLKVAKSLDMAAYEAMTEMAERLESLESSLQELSDNGVRYRGHWRDGMKAKRGEAFTHNGSTWWAARDTEDKPCAESMDWQMMVRRGRDARND